MEGAINRNSICGYAISFSIRRRSKMVVKTNMMGESPAPAGVKADGTKYRVLVVDDSIFIAKQLGQILQSEGFEVAGSVGDGAQGVEQFSVLRPDLVTMDITMPVMDGVTALEKILEIDKEAKVIMVSALGKEDVVKKCLMVGAKSFIIKPLDRNKVLQRIVSVVKR
jgi:two-component system chemotaxis response regulator CheY